MRYQYKQVCVEPPPSALNVTLPAFAAERRRACNTAPAAHPQLSIDISYLQGAQLQTRWPPLLLSIDGADRVIDRRTDGRTDGRLAVSLHRPCSA